MSDCLRSEARASFPTTHWSLVARVGSASSPEARQALERLFRAYWFPIYAFIRRRGADPTIAQDLTQSYFLRLLEKDLVIAADPRKGRFRAFLKTDCTHFLSDHRDREQARKRGGGRTMIPIESLDAEDCYAREVADNVTPERLFDRAWALTLLDRVLEQLTTEYGDSGRRALFERLQFALTGGPHIISYAELAEDLDTTEGAIQAAVHRLRRRYRTILREQIAETLDAPTDADIDAEIRDLFAALAR
jgi:RNA polymerase sigma factor (sigma-70 family)